MNTTTILAGVALGTIGLATVVAGSANASTPPLPAPSGTDGVLLLGVTDVTPPPGYVPPTARVQVRPVPPDSSLVGTGRLDIIAIAQRQLNQLGYGPIVVSGVDDGTTAAATASFARDQSAAVQEYQNVGMDLAHATLSAMDDKYRQNVGASQASDYIMVPSGGLAMNRYRRDARVRR